MPQPRKFKLGDKVVISKRCPKDVLVGIRRNRVRTVVSVHYDPIQQHIRYYLGTNFLGESRVTDYPFRAEYLERVKKRRVGRPKEKRKYRWVK